MTNAMPTVSVVLPPSDGAGDGSKGCLPEKSATSWSALTGIFHGATATSPWLGRQPSRGRRGSSKLIAVGYHSGCEISGLKLFTKSSESRLK
jgi:hypothetical protein